MVLSNVVAQTTKADVPHSWSLVVQQYSKVLLAGMLVRLSH
jgi:hypothetical protein